MSAVNPADFVLVGTIFDGDTVGSGYVALTGGVVTSIDLDGGELPSGFVGPQTRIVDATEGMITPGLFDNHCFFTSQLLEVGGVQCADLTREEIVAKAKDYLSSTLQVCAVLNVADDVAEDAFSSLTEAFPDRDFVLLSAERQVCLQTEGARATLGSVDGQSNEGLAPLYSYLASKPENVDAALNKFTSIATAAGVVAVKDIAFDQYLGMADQLNRRARSADFPLVMACASQPVLAPADLEFWTTEKDRLEPAGPHFRGFKLMTDGSFDEGGGALLPGSGLNNQCDWEPEQTYKEAQRVVGAGYPLILNADGDLAVHECIGIFERLAKKFGALPDGCTLSDGSIADPAESARLAKLNIPVETYPQMVRFDYYSSEFLAEYLTDIGLSRFAPFDHWAKEGVTILAATDFPLVEPSLPEALLSASERKLTGDPAADSLDGRGIDRLTVLRAWTSNPGDFMGLEQYTGRLRQGDPASLAVFDTNLITASPEALAEAGVTLTVSRGMLVFEA